MAAIREWMANNPELVVPIEYHEGRQHSLRGPVRRLVR